MMNEKSASEGAKTVGSIDWLVLPTSQRKAEGKDDPLYSDIALTGLFSAHVANINSQRQTIWQRYSVMLLANTAALAFWGTLTPDRAQTLALVLGVGLCVFWFLMTESAWRLYERLMKDASKFQWPALSASANPITTTLGQRSNQGEGHTRGTVYWCSMLVILSFLVAHVILGFVL